MACRHIEKYPTLWMGNLIVNGFTTMVKLIYVAGDISVAFDALPKIGEIPSIFFENDVKTKLIDDHIHKYKKSCVLTALPFGNTEEERQRHASTMFTGVIRYLKSIEATGATGVLLNDEECKVHLYLKSEGSTNILATLAPDWFHAFYDRLFLIVALYK
ncbi:SPOC domain-containing protein [Nephila pilipes]|uniref:SPOC domain-containing protein n=1 Tax=Nephila pilipes TaxID=299642 RepID=A0A8X6QSD1_NEPPI|nr:SPOC domain-containing protein [Nephila pilipes]